MFQELFDVAPDAMLAVDEGGLIARANAQAQRLFGYDELKLLGQPIEILLPERVRAVHRDHVHRYAHRPRVRPMGAGQELVGLRADGSEFPVEVALSPLQTEGGVIFVAAIRDISETQRARQALVRARYDSAIAQIGQLLLVAPSVDAALDGLIEHVAMVLHVRGIALAFKEASLNRMKVYSSMGLEADWVERLDQWLSSTRIERMAPHGEPVVFDPTRLGAAGDPFVVAAVAPLLDPSRPIGALIVLDEQTRGFDHDALHFLRAFSLMLSGAIQRIETQERLAHAQRLEALGQLTGGIAHDFNNLLTIVSGNLQILETELVDHADALEMLRAARRAATRGADLTRKLLAFARRQKLSPQVCRVDLLLRDLGDMLRRTLGDAIDLTISCPVATPPIFVDPGQLEAALINLAVNARDAMPRGGQLSITARTQTQGDLCQVVLSVRDTGIGMAPDVLARAPEPFFTTKHKQHGSGLGLSMVYGFVQQSGGRLAIDSRLGYGTQVELYLPAVEALPPKPAELPVTPATERGVVLVVEDQSDVRAVAARFLRTLGYDVHAVSYAEEALAWLDDGGTAVAVFSDIMLGSGMTGIEFADVLAGRRPHLPMLLTSGDERSLQAGTGDAMTHAWLRKPYLLEELAAALQRAIAAASRTQ